VTLMINDGDEREFRALLGRFDSAPE